MIYIYDIILNLLNSKRIYEFFEWEVSDSIENIKKIPLFVVSSDTLYDIVNNEVNLCDDFLKLIKNKTLVFGDREDQVIKYAFLLTNKECCYAFELNDQGNVIFKSSLLLDEEEEILSISKTMRLYDLKYELIKANNNYKSLTRKEEKKIEFIVKELNKTYKENEYSKMDYLYQECFNKKSTYEKEYNKLLEIVSKNNKEIINKLYFILKLSSDVYIRKGI